MSSVEMLLRCRDVTRTFGGLTALDGVDLDIQRGEIIGLIGPNGSGKTTLFNLLTGIYSFSAGAADFEGSDLTRKSPQKTYEIGITRTFQRSRMCLPLSIFDNLMIGNHKNLNNSIIFNIFKRNAFKRQLEHNIEQAQRLVRVFNSRLANDLFQEAGALHMLDRRRIEICRALISRPKLVLLDEPSAGMTTEETHQLMEDIHQVRRFNPELSIILIEHEMSAIENVTDHCVVLNFGKKIAEGDFTQVTSNPQVKEAYLGSE